MFAASVEDSGFKAWSGICCFSTKHTSL